MSAQWPLWSAPQEDERPPCWLCGHNCPLTDRLRWTEPYSVAHFRCVVKRALTWRKSFDGGDKVVVYSRRRGPAFFNR